MTSYPGWYFDGRTGAKRAVRATPVASYLELQFEDGGTSIRVAPHEAVQEFIPGGVAFQFADGTILELPGTDWSRARSIKQRPGRRRLVEYTVGIVVVVAAIFFVQRPLSRLIARHVPATWEQSAGDNIATHFPTSDCGGERTQATLNKLVGALGKENADRVKRIAMMEGPPNAFAHLGGYVYVTRGLVGEAESPNEVLGVLAHEVGHLANRHSVAALVRQQLVSILWSVTFGFSSSTISPEMAQNLASLSHSRADETEADDFAASTLVKAGYSTDGLRSFFDRMHEKEGDFSLGSFGTMLSTHPASTERSERLKNAPRPKREKGWALTKAEWKQWRQDCAPKKSEDDDE